MKKIISMMLALVLALSLPACGNAEGADGDRGTQAGDFSFSLPQGYSVANESPVSCLILSDEDSTPVGGVEVMDLRRRDLTDKDCKNILAYLQNSFHKTNNIEYCAFTGEGADPHVGITLVKTHDDTGEKENFYHSFFGKDGLIYHCWLLTDRIGEETKGQILSAVNG